MSNQKLRIMNVVFICLLSVGCSYQLFTSKKTSADSPQDMTGIPYYLPQSTFIVNLNVADTLSEKFIKDKDGNVLTREDIRGYEITIKVTQKLIPDPNHLYLLKYHSSFWYNDNIDVRVSKDGFIQTVVSNLYDENEQVEISGESKDESEKQLSNTFKANYEIAKKSDSEQLNFLQQLGEDFKVLKGAQSFVFYSSGEEQIKKINTLSTHGQVQLKFSCKKFEVPDTEKTPKNNETENFVVLEEFNNGIKFRLPYPYIINISLQYQDALQKTITLSEMNTIALLPDHSPIYTLPMERYALVHAALAAEFSNGQFQNTKLKKISPIYEVLSLPKNIILEVENLLEAVGKAINSPIGTLLGVGAAGS